MFLCVSRSRLDNPTATTRIYCIRVAVKIGWLHTPLPGYPKCHNSAMPCYLPLQSGTEASMLGHLSVDTLRMMAGRYLHGRWHVLGGLLTFNLPLSYVTDTLEVAEVSLPFVTMLIIMVSDCPHEHPEGNEEGAVDTRAKTLGPAVLSWQEVAQHLPWWWRHLLNT